jgi:hypothetical protein
MRALDFGNLPDQLKNTAVDVFVTSVIRGEAPLLQKRSFSGFPLCIAGNTSGVS